MRAFESTTAAPGPQEVGVDALFGAAPTKTDAERVEMLEQDLRELRAVLWQVWVRASKGNPDDRPCVPSGEQTAWEQITPIFHRWFPK
jgi:hypothetical protein